MVRQALVVCVMAPPIHLGAWSMAIELSTLGAHAQRGLQYLLCVSVCLCVCLSVTALAATGFISACNQQHLQHSFRLFFGFKLVDFRKSGSVYTRLAIYTHALIARAFSTPHCLLPYCIHSPHSTYARTWNYGGCTEMPGSALGNNSYSMQCLHLRIAPSVLHLVLKILYMFVVCDPCPCALLSLSLCISTCMFILQPFQSLSAFVIQHL